MCTITGKVRFRTLPKNYLYEKETGYVKKKRTIWNIVKGWFSLYEINGAPSPGGYKSCIYG